MNSYLRICSWGDLIPMGTKGLIVTSGRRRGLLLAAEGGKIVGASQSWHR